MSEVEVTGGYAGRGVDLNLLKYNRLKQDLYDMPMYKERLLDTI